MKCNVCGIQSIKNLCEFCGNIVLIEPLISEHDIKQYMLRYNIAKKNIEIAKSKKNFRIKGDVLIEYIGDSEFVIIPDKIRVIAEHCFKGSNVKKVKISAKVEYIGNEPKDGYENNNGAFIFCEQLEAIYFDDDSKLKSIERYAFYGCKKLKKIVGLPKFIQIVKPHAFCQCDELNKESIDTITNNTDKKGLAANWNN